MGRTYGLPQQNRPFDAYTYMYTDNKYYGTEARIQPSIQVICARSRTGYINVELLLLLLLLFNHTSLKFYVKNNVQHWSGQCNAVWCLRSFYPASVPTLPPAYAVEIYVQALWSQNHDTRDTNNTAHCNASHFYYWYLVYNNIGIIWASSLRRPLRSLTRKNTTECELMERTERPMVLRANWRLANAKISMLQENNPDAARMQQYEMERTERRSATYSAAAAAVHQVPSCISHHNFLRDRK